jgi:2,3-dihydroxybenzoate decarboxylase
MRTVALEEAFWLDGLHTSGSFLSTHPPFTAAAVEDIRRRLPDFTELRLPEMDRTGVDVQVLSLTSPGVQMQPDTRLAVADAQTANDYLASVIARHPARFGGLAAVALQDPDAAAAELARAVTDLGLSGALVNDHTLGHYLDEPQFESFWNELERLDVPLYIHPNAVPADDWNVLKGHQELVGPTWSWGATTAGHAMRLIYGGVFDRHPDARIILGHMGEFLPYQLARFDRRHAYLDLQEPINRLPSQYFGHNIMITTTGVLSHSALIAAIDAVGIDNVMFSVDYPYESSADSVAFLNSAPLPPDQLAQLAHGNADRVLRMPQRLTAVPALDMTVKRAKN